MIQKNQVIFIRWWEAFDTKEQYYEYLKDKEYKPFEEKKSWRDWLAWALSIDFEAFIPEMPAKQNADYVAWKIWFKKIFPYLNKSKMIIVASSLGGLFIAKYLSENQFPKHIDQLHLVAPTFDNEDLVWERVWNFDFDKNLLSNLEKQTDKIFLYHSKDDHVNPFSASEKYMKYFTKAQFQVFQNRWHFDQPAFIELLNTIQNNL